MEELKQRILLEGKAKSEGGIVLVNNLPVVFIKKKVPAGRLVRKL